VEGAPGCFHAALSHENFAWIGLLLQTSCDIHRVARDQKLAVFGFISSDNLARIHTDT
jgi:hypothetical protein